MTYARIESLNRTNGTARVTILDDNSSCSSWVTGTTHTAREFWTDPEGLQAGDVVEVTYRDEERKDGRGLKQVVVVVRLEWRRAA
jgi:hypothetical protein